MVTVVDASPLHRPSSSSEISRRRLLRLAGTAGLTVAAAGACSTEPTAGPSSAQPPRSARPAAPVPSALAGPAPAPAAPPLPPVQPASNVMLCRTSWGAAPPIAGGTPHVPSFMTVHHTAVVLGDNANAPARLRQHQQYHQGTHGWIDIAYHLSVDRNGNIYELRDPNLVGDTATSYDPTGHFLVVCEGNFDEEDITEEQLNGAALAFAWAAEQYGIPAGRLAGHKDASGDTSCPGASLYARIPDLTDRVGALLATPPVNLQKICGPEAGAIAAEIESGAR